MATQVGIYVIKHTPTGHCYVGQSSNIKLRWRGHRTLLNGGCHHSPRLQNAWNRYGAEQFAFEIVSLCPVGLLTEQEQYFIDTLLSVFNVAKIAGTRRGVPHPPEVRARIAAKLAGHIKSKETCARLSAALVGRKLSPDHCAKISENKSNVSDETRRKLSAAAKGRRHSNETKAKMGLAHKGRIVSAETRDKLRSVFLGRQFSEETRAKMSASARRAQRKPHSEETRAKMSAAASAREEKKKTLALEGAI